MPQRPINLSPDLKKLRDEGYDIEVRAGHLIVNDVPYVNSNRELKRGTLVTTLMMANDKTMKPDTHVMQFGGDYPCNRAGVAMSNMVIDSTRRELVSGVWIGHTFSVKPLSGAYDDYYAKVTRMAHPCSPEPHARNHTHEI
jgi:hypothetical protein